MNSDFLRNVINTSAQKVTVFVTDNHFHLSLIFVGKSNSSIRDSTQVDSSPARKY